MRAYSIHEPEPAPGDPLTRADAVQVVKEGIAWWALFMPLLWLIYHQMWLVLLGVVVLTGAIELLAVLGGFSEAGAFWMSMAFSLVFALFANDLRRWTLARRGYVTSGAVTAGSVTEAELKYFSGWEQGDGRNRPAAIAATLHPGEAGSGGTLQSEAPVIGLFPEAER